MFKIDDFRLRTKTLIPMALASTATIGVAVLSGLQLDAFTTRSSEIIERRDRGLADLLQSARFINRSLNVPFRSVLYDGADPLLKGAEAALDEYMNNVAKSLQHAMEMLPERRTELESYLARFDGIRSDLRGVLAIGLSVQSLTVGRAMPPRDLDMLANASNIMHGADAKAMGLIDDLAVMVKGVSTENAERSAQLQADGALALKKQIAIGLIATLMAAALALWMVSRKIVAPLGRLTDRMTRLANGDLDAEVEDVNRRDEVGQMAAAVRVFRTNAIERRRLEAVAEEQRAVAENERREAAAQRTQAADERAATARREAEQMAHVSAEREAIAAEQTRALRQIGDAIRALAVKSLDHRIAERLHADYEPLRAEFNAALDQLAQAFVEVAGAAGSVHHGTQEISTAANDLARRTEQQASNIEETASALNEITATVQKTAQGAAAARDSVADARSDAAKGAEVIIQTTQAMSRIETSAKKVAEIIGVIDEIAFQTNLLALNAGVEAARAGDAGRGFAVVASEVRALAQRAADAAKEIKELISVSGQEVQYGVALVAETGDALTQIGKTVTRIDEIVSVIAVDAHAQANGLTEINKAVRQVDQMTQQNAALAEETTAASQNLSRESHRLSTLVAGFKVGRGGGGVDEADLRAELRRAAPHAVAAHPSPPPGERRAGRPPRLIAAAGGGHAAAEPAGGDWKEF